MSGRCVGWGLMALLAGGCSVGSTNDALSFGDPNTVPGGDTTSTSGVVMTSDATDDPSGVGGSTELTTGSLDPVSETTAGSGTDPSSGGSSGAAAACGNGVVEADEACDGLDLAGTSCADIGAFVGGALLCDPGCAFDTTGCMEQPMDPIEVCEAISLAIPDAGGTVSSSVTLPAEGTVADATVGVTVAHTFIRDLRIDVEHEGSTVRVYDGECGVEDDIDLIFDDAGVALNCAASVSGAATLPSQPLSGFDGIAAGGVWTFSFQDAEMFDIGTATEICVTVSF